MLSEGCSLRADTIKGSQQVCGSLDGVFLEEIQEIDNFLLYRTYLRLKASLNNLQYYGIAYANNFDTKYFNSVVSFGELLFL